MALLGLNVPSHTCGADIGWQSTHCAEHYRVGESALSYAVEMERFGGSIEVLSSSWRYHGSTQMHWIVQTGIYRRINHDLLIGSLKRAELPYTEVAISQSGLTVDPPVDPHGPVIVCGAVNMAKVSEVRGWKPGSFLNENFDFSRWTEVLDGELLNTGAEYSKLGALSIDQDSFVRPIADNKAFDGRVFRHETFEAWKNENPQLHDLDVLTAAPREIFREYRLFIVKGRVVTGSQYMQAGQAHLATELDPEALEYTQSVIGRWQPADAFVLDVALTPAGYKVIEFNNINSSGFYASDVDRFVSALEAAFG